MSGYETEAEQVEALKRWWKDNGRSVLAGVAIALVAVIGWYQWQDYQRGQSLDASAAYETVVSRITAGDTAGAAEAVAQLREGNGAYAVLASLRLAGALVADGELERAEEALNWARDNAPDDGMGRLARVRLAQVLDAMERDEEALSVLEPVPDGPFAARYHELIGDLQVDLGNTAAAVEAYRAAVDADPLNRRRGLIEMKLADLGAEVEPAS